MFIGICSCFIIFHVANLWFQVYDAGDVFKIECVQEVDDESEDNEADDGESSHTWRVVVNNEDGIKCMDKKQ